MTSVALKGLLGRKLRAVLTALSIVLGVAMVSGSFVLTDSIQQAFHTLFSSSYSNTDAVDHGQEARRLLELRERDDPREPARHRARAA